MTTVMPAIMHPVTFVSFPSGRSLQMKPAVAAAAAGIEILV